MSEQDRTYPYKAWSLKPSFKPFEVELVRRAYDYSYPDWDSANSGTTYNTKLLHPSKEAAIAFGRQEVARLEADLAKRAERIQKRTAALDKAEREAT